MWHWGWSRLEYVCGAEEDWLLSRGKGEKGSPRGPQVFRFSQFSLSILSISFNQEELSRTCDVLIYVSISTTWHRREMALKIST